MNGGGIFFCKRWFFGFLKVFELGAFRSIARIFTANAVDCNAVRDGVEPPTQGTWVFKLSNTAEDLEPHILQNVECSVLSACQTHRVIEQRPLHHCDQVFEYTQYARLAAEYEPFRSGPEFLSL